MSTPQGVQITASKVHVPFKTELINEIASPRFAGRAPHLVGILATDKEDARTYAEVGRSLPSRNAVPGHSASYQLGMSGEQVLTAVHQESMRADWYQL
jgi:5,10-methylene-tetrahydrofolate dehydrogenase/methenyl tetrahydrofolate cyclohydrolase